MSLTILNNMSAIAAENQLNITSAEMNSTLEQLSSGSRINSGADDPAGLAIADGLQANVAALTQSGSNATDGVGELQVADGALSQVTTLLDRAVTLATEAANGGLSTAQSTALTGEYTAIQNEITNIGANTNYNGAQVFTANAVNVYLTDGTTSGSTTISATPGALTLGSLNLTASNLGTTTSAQTQLGQITSAIATVAATRGSLGASVEELQAASNVMTVQTQNLTSAENNITAADIPSAVANLSQYSILEQTGISALSQANQQQQLVLKLLQ
jgi:flagellin